MKPRPGEQELEDDLQLGPISHSRWAYACSKALDEWLALAYLREKKLFGNDDPLFPRTKQIMGPDLKLVSEVLEPSTWSSAGPIREILKTAFQHAGIAYFNPHSFRDTLVILGEQICKTPEQFKAWSQNLGHEGVLTTLFAYGTVPERRQREIMSGWLFR